MHTTGFFAVGIVVGLFALVVFGAAWFIAIPLGFLFFLVPVAFAAAFAARASDRRATHPTGSEAMPSSQQASYDPVVDPSEPPATR